MLDFRGGGPGGTTALEQPTQGVSFMRSRQDIKDKTFSWLRDAGWMVSDRTHKEARWMLVAMKEGAELFAFEPREGDRLILSYEIKLSDSDFNVLQQLEREQQEELVWNLWHSMLLMNVDLYADAPIPRTIRMSVQLYYDAFSQDAFMRRLTRLNSGFRIVGLAFRKAAGELLHPFTPPEPIH